MDFFLIWFLVMAIVCFIDIDLVFPAVLISLLCFIFAQEDNTDYIQDHVVVFEQPMPILEDFTTTIITKEESDKYCSRLSIKTDAGIACAPALEPTFDELGNELPATEPHVNLCPAMTITRSDHSPITEYLITNIKAKTGSFYPAEIKKCVGLIIETANAFYAHSAYKYSIKESENKSSAWETVPSVQHPMPELSEKLNNEAEAASEEGQ